MKEAYRTLGEYGEDEFEVSKSRFIGSARRVKDEDDALDFLASIKSKYPQARHYCSAWVLGEGGLEKRYDDNKEPQGTAGMPILHVLESNELTQACIVVTRYFGGTLLGTGGLTRAYSKAAAIAVEASGIVMRVPLRELKIILDYGIWGSVQNRIAQQEVEIMDIVYEDTVDLRILVEEEKIADWSDYLAGISSGKATLLDTGVVWRSKNVSD